MKRFIIAAIAAVALASTPAAAQTTVGLEALAGVTGRAYSFGGWAKVRMVVLSVDLGCLKHQMEEDGADATHRDRLLVAGIGARFGPVVVSGHVGQAVRSHTDYLYGGSVRLKSFTVRGLYLNDEPAERKMYFQAGFHLPLKTIGGSSQPG